jgi:hypothetical protein
MAKSVRSTLLRHLCLFQNLARFDFEDMFEIEPRVVALSFSRARGLKQSPSFRRVVNCNVQMFILQSLCCTSKCSYCSHCAVIRSLGYPKGVAPCGHHPDRAVSPRPSVSSQIHPIENRCALMTFCASLSRFCPRSTFVCSTVRFDVLITATSCIGTEAFSCSTDGQVLWWDIRKLTEPFDSLTLSADTGSRLHGAVVLEYEPSMPTKFMVRLILPAQHIYHCIALPSF